MASKRKQKQALAAKRQMQKQHRPASRLQEAQQAFASGNFAQAQQLAEAALNAANDPATKQTLQTLLTEIYLRRAASSAHLAEQLSLLTKAVQLQPNQARLYYHLGLTQWRAGDVQKAAVALEQTAQREAGRKGLLFLRQLAAVANGQPWRKDGLSPAEVNTLDLLQRLRQNAPTSALATSLENTPLLGNQPAAWLLLLQMLANAQSAPVASWQKLTEATPPVQTPAVLHYYQGVAAMRKGEVNAAIAAWQQAAARLTTPWLAENLVTARREQAAALAQAQQWSAVVDLFAQTRREVGEVALDEALIELAALAHFHLGCAATAQNQWPVALTHFRAANELHPSRPLLQNLALAEEMAEDWFAAATAWREMIRRRPRKADHPDALSDAQVAAIWARAAHCYFETEDLQETITCLKNAIKYAPTNLALRISLVEMYLHVESTEAAENELNRILAEDANYIPALTRLGVLQADRWDRDPLPLWQRVLAQEPQNQEARQAVAEIYVKRATEDFVYQHHFGKRLTPARTIATLEAGLQEVPNQPILLVALGLAHAEQKRYDRARTYLQQAAQAAPKDIQILGAVLHELLHVDGGALVEELMPQLRQIGGLRPSFWADQGEKVLSCELEVKWAEFFWDEAIRASEKFRGEDSVATTLLKIFHLAMMNEQRKLALNYERQLRKDFAHIGAVEFIEAVYAFEQDPNKKNKATTLLNTAVSKATRAGETGIAAMAQSFRDFIKRPPLPSFFGQGFGGLDPDGPLDPEALLEILANLNKEELDALRRFL